MSRTVLALILALASALAAQEPGPEQADKVLPDPYPPARNASVLRFLTLEGGIEGDAWREALAALSNEAQKCRALFGPTTSSTRPDKQYVVLELPPARTP